MRRRRPNIAAAAGVLAACVVLVVATGGVATGASTATTTVSVTVASATSINAAGCASGTANVTDFGTVLPATSNVTSTDCTVVFGSSNDTSMLRAYQTDQAGSALFGLSNGALDTTFDADGIVTTAIGGLTDEATAVAVQADGKIVVVGASSNGADYDFAIARYTTAGALDATFDGDGRAVTAVGAGNDRAYAVVVQADGKIDVAGSAAMAGNDDFAVVRYNTNGSLDTTFDTDGKATTTFGAGSDRAEGMAIQADGKIVLAGYWWNGANDDFAIARYNTDGSLDTAFDTDGMVSTAIGGADAAKGVAIQADGKIVVTGYTFLPGNFDFAATRYDASGALDASFDGDGKAVVNFSANDDYPTGVGLQADGKIVLVGKAWNGANDDFAAARLTTAGALDTTFDSDGKIAFPIGSSTDKANAVAIQADGKIVLAGMVSAAQYRFGVARLTTAGALDTSFDSDGTQTTMIGAVQAEGDGVAIQADGKIVVAGYYVAANQDFAVVRYGGGGSVADWAGSWGAANLFGACLHTVANATNTWTLAGSGNCTTAIDANWNALPTTASKIASAGSGVTNATTNLRYGFKATASQQAGTYIAPLTFEVVAPNA